MSSTSPAWTVIGLLLAAGAAALLIRRARQGDSASRWLAVVTVTWAAAFAAQGASAGQVTPAVIQLTLTDLLALLGLAPLVVGLLRLAPAAPDRQVGIRRISDPGRLVDAGLLVLAAFGISWIAALRTAYRATAVGPGLFTVDLIHPVADLAVLSGTLWLAIRAGRRALAPYLALCAATVGDFLAVQARASGMHPGTWPQLAWLLAFCLLGASALPLTAGADEPAADAVPGATDPPLSTLIAVGAAGVASLVTLIFAIVTWGHSGPVPLIAGALLTLALAARIAGPAPAGRRDLGAGRAGRQPVPPARRPDQRRRAAV